MRKTVISVIVLVAFLQSVAGITSDLGEAYAPRETIIGKISGNVLSPISKEQINLVRGRHLDVGFDYGIKKIGGEHYLWMIAPQNEGNYTLIIKEVVTTVDGYPEVVDYMKNFSVVGKRTDYSIKPGIVLTSKDFEITATLYEDFSKTISVDFPEAREVVLNPGDNKIVFSTEGVIGTQFVTISVGKYGVPASLLGGDGEINETGNESEETDDEEIVEDGEVYYPPRFRFNPKMIRGTILKTAQYPYYSFEIANVGEKQIADLYFYYDTGKMIVFPDREIFIESNETAYFNLSLKNITENVLRRKIIALSGGKAEYLLFEVNFTSNAEETFVDYYKEDDSGQVSLYYCSEFSGKICGSGEICSAETISSLDGICCIGKCESETGKSKAWIGYLIAAIAILVLLIIYVKYKKTGAVKNPLAKRVSDVERKLP